MTLNFHTDLNRIRNGSYKKKTPKKQNNNNWWNWSYWIFKSCPLRRIGMVPKYDGNSNIIQTRFLWESLGFLHKHKMVDVHQKDIKKKKSDEL